MAIVLSDHTPTQSIVTPQGGQQRIGIIYARVSTTEQADRGYSLPTQIEACQAMARQEGYTVPDTHVFVDDYTGTSLNRPQFTKLRDLVRQRLVQAVFVHDLDRLSRKLAHQLLLSDEFEQAGVARRIVTMPDSEKTPEGQLLTNVRGIIAEYERAKILERTARGRRGRSQAGHIPGGRCTLGYRYVKHADQGAHYEIEPAEAVFVQWLFQYYMDSGCSLEALARKLTAECVPTPIGRFKTPPRTIWHTSTLAHILHNTAYIGTLYDYKRQSLPSVTNPDKKTRWRSTPRAEWLPIPVPRIIPQDLFDAVQAKLAANKARATRNRKYEDYLFIHGRLRCGQCGRAMGGFLDNYGHPRYRCSRGHRKYLDAETPHTQRSIATHLVEPVVWDAVLRALDNPALIAAELERRRNGSSASQDELHRERWQYERQLAQCDKDVKRWEAAYLGEAIDLADFKTKKIEVDARRASAAQELARLDEQQHLIEQAAMETASLTDYCARVRSELQTFTVEEKRRALEVLNITVRWYPNRKPEIQASIPVDIASNAVGFIGGNITFRLTA